LVSKEQNPIVQNKIESPANKFQSASIKPTFDNPFARSNPEKISTQQQTNNKDVALQELPQTPQ
jgi:hypothetical protein